MRITEIYCQNSLVKIIEIMSTRINILYERRQEVVTAPGGDVNPQCYLLGQTQNVQGQHYFLSIFPLQTLKLSPQLRTDGYIEICDN